MNIINILNEFIAKPAMALLAPQRCLVCGKILVDDEFTKACMCKKCYNNLPLFTNFYEMNTRLIGSVSREGQAVDRAFGMINRRQNSKYMQLIYNLKYYNYRMVGYELGRELAAYMQQCDFVGFDVVIPVPIHAAKKRERGYNQSDLIAKAVGDGLGIPFDLKSVKRIVYTNTQTKQGQGNRHKNVEGIFQVDNPEKFRDKCVLVVDDVFTTGSTINSVALELKATGAKSVCAATLAVA